MEYVVYEITCKVNGRKYYGRSQEYDKRRRAHLNMLRSNTHRNMYMQEDWNSFGEDCFTFKIIHTFDCLEDSIQAEQRYIEGNLGVGYNIGGASDGGDRMIHNPRREETLKLKSKVFSGEGNPMFGRPKTEKMIASVKESNSKKVSIDGKIYSSVVEASKVLGINKNTIYSRVRSKTFHTYYYVDDKSRTTISKESRLQA